MAVERNPNTTGSVAMGIAIKNLSAAVADIEEGTGVTVDVGDGPVTVQEAFDEVLARLDALEASA